MIVDGLLAQLHLFVFPIASGSGDRLFADRLVKFEVAGTEVYDNGVVHLSLTPRS